MWRWFRWILLSLGIIIIGVITVFLVMKPKKSEMSNIAIPAYQDPQCSREFKPQYSNLSYYQGPLFDSHFHIPSTFRSKFNSSCAVLEKTITLNQIICEFQKEKVVGAIAFYSPNPWLMFNLVGPEVKDETINQWAEQGKTIKQGLPDWVHLFYYPFSENKEEAQKIYDSYSNIYEGFGELVFLNGQSARSGSKVDDEISLKAEKIANDHKLVVMVHPEPGDRALLENALRQNPSATFIIHGWDHDDYVMNLMSKYKNFYFTLDGATLYAEMGKFQGPEDKFKTGFTKNYQANLDRAVSKWKPQIARNPDRYLWGTDRSSSFHYTEEMGRNFEEFARTFIGKLDPEYQEYVAYKNAQRLFSTDKSDVPNNKQSQKKQSLGDLPEAVRVCAINQIGEDKWHELSTSTRLPTAAEEQIINQCRK